VIPPKSLSEDMSEYEGVNSVMAKHLRFYHEGRKKLAEMMGKPHESFTDKYVSNKYS